jgi:subfamily B ATP-binding cassette protein MsbA
MAGPIGTFVKIYTQLQETLGAMRRVNEILDTKPLVNSPENPVKLTSLKGHVCFSEVIFGYEDGTPVLNNISFDIHPGKTVALIGPSGAGKSTTVQLLLRFFDPQSGKIQIDGDDLKSLDLESYLSQVALVPQETLLFGGTIRENILYGKLDATDTEMIEASKSANAHEFIVEFSNGYDTLVGEKGTKLSGGERQRIAIARALLKNPKILVLDEATSALDNQSEMLIQDALEKLMAGRTTFIIAHRLSTVHNADKIIVLDKAKIVESGTHKELMANEGLYHHLYTMRFIEAESPSGASV